MEESRPNLTGNEILRTTVHKAKISRQKYAATHAKIWVKRSTLEELNRILGIDNNTKTVQIAADSFINDYWFRIRSMKKYNPTKSMEQEAIKNINKSLEMTNAPKEDIQQDSCYRQEGRHRIYRWV